MKKKCPIVISGALSRFQKIRSICSYSDGGEYSDGYGDRGYGDYGDSVEDPDPIEK